MLHLSRHRTSLSFLGGTALGVIATIAATRTVTSGEPAGTRDPHAAAAGHDVPRIEPYSDRREASRAPTSETDTFPAGEAAQRLKVRLFDYTGSDQLVRFLVGLNEEQAAALSDTLDEFHLRTIDHEIRTMKILSETPEKTEIEVPPLFEGPDAESKFKNELAGKLGPTLAEEFISAADPGLEMRFSFWGTARQAINIDTSDERVGVGQRFIKEGMEARFEVIQKPDNPAFGRFSHLFRFEGTTSAPIKR